MVNTEAPVFDASWGVDKEHPDGVWRFYKYEGRKEITAQEYRELRDKWHPQHA
jgi:hypothetical protein